MTDLSAEDAVAIEELMAEPLATVADDGASAVFSVRLDNFEGPFDLLLNLISRRQLDVTEVALSQVTDEFISYLAAMETWDLGKATEFLVVAATLLDLKAARLLPAADIDDEEDLALLEARDLLFARLLQYRAYKQVATRFGRWEAEAARRFPRAVALEPRFAEAMPEVLLGIGAQRFAELAAAAMAPRQAPTVGLDHVHAPRVSVREHAAVIRDRLRRTGAANFRSLCSDCESTLEVVARFLALLELYREGVVAFDQVEALGDLHVRWTGAENAADEDDPDLDIDEYGDEPAVDAEAPAETGSGDSPGEETQ